MQFLTNRKKKYSRVWIVLSVFVLIMVLRFIQTPLRSVFVFVTHPFISLGTGIQNKTTVFSSTSKSKQELLTEIDSLKKENEALVLENNSLMQGKALVEEFKNSFGLFPSELQLQYAHVFSKPNQSVYDTLLVSEGSNEGIAVGQSVFINNYALIGLVDSVTKDNARIVLFSSPGQKTNGRLERSGYDITLVGRGGGNMVVELPKEIETALGDKITYPLENNHVIGIIRDITVDDRDANKKIYITLPTNILTLDHVYIKK